MIVRPSYIISFKTGLLGFGFNKSVDRFEVIVGFVFVAISVEFIKQNIIIEEHE